MKELTDYSGEFIPEMHLEMFSKDTLIELMKLYSRFFRAVDGFWYLAVKEKVDNDKAMDCDMWVLEKLSQYEPKRIAKLMKIEGNDVAALVKVFQLNQWFWGLDYKLELKNRNHAVLTVVHCPTLVALEEEGEGRDESICQVVETKFFKDFASSFNPDIGVKYLKIPPRKSKDEICCQWEFKLEN